ncbi:hypothetical protein, partial [Leucobacter sp. M11]|uniref:hypothetical protein n=1 Tax=Leucobacter sp. M11 TaxID=2993565 RepID=UPI002D80A6B8
MAEPAATRVQIRVFRTRDGRGTPSPDERVEAVTIGAFQSAAGQASTALLAYSPSLTSTPGVFSFSDSERGSGWLRLEGAGAFTLTRVSEAVRLSEIERALGQQDPIPGRELGAASPLAFHNRSPIVQTITGAAVLWGGGILASVLASPNVDTLPKAALIGALSLG